MSKSSNFQKLKSLSDWWFNFNKNRKSKPKRKKREIINLENDEYQYN